MIETKSRAGTIYGDEDDDEWTQVLGYDDRIEHVFANPIIQNEYHVNALKRLLNNPSIPIYSLVVFTNGDLSHVVADGVVSIDKFEHTVVDMVGEGASINGIDLKIYYNRVSYYKIHPIKTSKQHKEEVKNYHKN